MKLTKSAATVGVQKINTTYLSDEMQVKLNGFNLADAQEQGLITAEKFINVNKTYSYADGNTKTFSHIELVTDKGNVVISKNLYDNDGAGLKAFEARLGDLTFNRFMTKEDGDRPSQLCFRLQKPGGGVLETRDDLQIGQ